MKNIAFRVDSSADIGSGHLMRCLTLAEQLKKHANILFICRELTGSLINLICKNGYELIQLPLVVCVDVLIGYEKWLTVTQNIDANQTLQCLRGRDIDCLIIDHYALDAQWEKKLRPCAKKIMVIDDLANRSHACDLLLDQNDQAERGEKYSGLLPTHCRCFLGLKYVLLRQEFYRAEASLQTRDGSVQRVFVFFGGSDPTMETKKALQAIRLLERPDILFDIVVGAGNLDKEGIAAQCRIMSNVRYYCQIDHIAELMANADAAIGAAGSSIWERCFLGLPSLVVSVAENQGRTQEPREGEEPFYFLGWHEHVSVGMLAEAMKSFFCSPEKLVIMSQAARALFSGENGQADLIGEILKGEED